MFNRYLEDAFALEISERDGDFVKSGNIVERKGYVSIPIKDYILRFCDEGYSSSFGMQWHRFKNLQLDSKTGLKHSRNRLVMNTRWNLEKLNGRSVLECGCGPGRFTEIFVQTGADVVAVDMSRAIDVNLENNGNRKNLMLLQCDISQMSFFQEKFDYVFCYGVLQHTPHPEKTFGALVKYLKSGGRISIDIYRKYYIPTPWSTPKYLWRPLTKRMDKERLLKILKWYIPKYIDVDTFIKTRIKGGWLLAGLIPVPCWNYVNMGYSREEVIQHAIMDTFDALSPRYDVPKIRKDVLSWFRNHPELIDIEVFHGSNGIVGNARKG